MTTIAHGTELFKLGFTVDQIVHDYIDLCQVITHLAAERDAPSTIDEYRRLNRCLDDAIADAVTKFSYLSKSAKVNQKSADLNVRLGILVHELNNVLNASMHAVYSANIRGKYFSSLLILKRSNRRILNTCSH
ncbi:MAG: hypothetical protein EOP06_25905 [Proteobacteria bacterium]|nr:MAG: hypothetical protein EOP06_25905 [Pseudomonadota bacterium]